MKTLTMNEVEQVSGGFIGGLMSFSAGAFSGALLAGSYVGIDVAAAITAGGVQQGVTVLFALPTLPAVIAGALTGGIILNAVYNLGSSSSRSYLF